MDIQAIQDPGAPLAEQEAKQEAKSAKAAEKPKTGGDIVYVPRANEPQDMSAEDRKALAEYRAAGGGAVPPLFQKKAQLDELNKMLEGIKKTYGQVKDIGTILDELHNPKVSPEEEAQIRENIPQADRSALDFLLQNKPDRLEKPQLSEEAEARQLIITSLMNAAASAIQGIVGSGMMPDAGAMASSTVFNEQAQRISLTEDKIREIEQKQMAIDLKYKDDVVAAMQAYDADMDETAKMYLMERNRIIMQKIESAKMDYSLLQDKTNYEMALTGMIQREKSETESTNLRLKQDWAGQVAAMKRDEVRFLSDVRRQRQMEAKLSTENIVRLVPKSAVEGGLAQNTFGLSTAQTNNVYSGILAKSNTDPVYSERVSRALYQRSSVINSAEGLLPTITAAAGDDMKVVRRIQDDLFRLVQTYGIVPGRTTVEALAKNTLTPAEHGEAWMVPDAVRQAMMIDNPGAVATTYYEDETAGQSIMLTELTQAGEIDAFGRVQKSPEQEALELAWVIGVNAGAVDHFKKTDSALKMQALQKKAEGN